MGAMIGYAQYRFFVKEALIQDSLKQDIEEYAKQLDKDPNTITVIELNRDSKILSEDYKDEALGYIDDADVETDPTTKAYLLAEADASMTKSKYYEKLYLDSNQGADDTKQAQRQDDFAVTKQGQIIVALMQQQQ